jgi:hypothetical protein
MWTAAQEVDCMLRRPAREGRIGWCPICRKNLLGVLVGSDHGIQNQFGFHEHQDLVCTNHGAIGEPMQQAREEESEDA